ncbi:MAG: hypothetical protein LQ342_007492 [Letrouitia transgressa]|nr:MAG: hypothetical protein LQ342_007492 [Letrouitia transgressa]
MAPMALDDAHPLKRTSSTAEFDIPPSKKLNRGLKDHHHKLTWDFGGLHQSPAPLQDENLVHSILTRSICLALRAVGFDGAAPLVLESFCAEVEEYMNHFLKDVRQSMYSCRRTQPIPQDFLQALHTHQLSLRALLPHLDPPVSAADSRITLSKEPEEKVEQQHHFDFLGPALNDPPNVQTKLYVPSHFPPFPSRHTYKETPDFAEREKDPRKLRERAIEEGRLGEEALRKLVSAGSRRTTAPVPSGGGGRDLRVQRNSIWRETMVALDSSLQEKGTSEMTIDNRERGQEESPKDVLGRFGRPSSIVNADVGNWRKPPSKSQLQHDGDYVNRGETP